MSVAGNLVADAGAAVDGTLVAPPLLAVVDEAPELSRAWSFALGAVSRLTSSPVRFGGFVEGHLRLGERWHFTLHGQLTQGTSQTITVDNLTRGTATTTPGTLWAAGGACWGERLAVCPQALVGARVWAGSAEGPYLFHTSAQFAANLLMGLEVLLRLPLVWRLELEGALTGLWAPVPASFAVAGAPGALSSTPALELQARFGLGLTF